MWGIGRSSSKRDKGKLYIEDAEAEKKAVNLTVPNETVQKQLDLIGLTEDDLAILRQLRPFVTDQSAEMTDAFYTYLLSVPELKEKVEQYSSVRRLKKTLTVHIGEMFTGQIDQAYYEKRSRIAKMHFYIGLSSKWYMGSFQSLLIALMRLCNGRYTTDHERIRAAEACTKILNFEQQLVLEAYDEAILREKENDHEQVKNTLKEQIASVTEELMALSEQTHASVDQLISSSEEVSSTVKDSSNHAEKTQTQAEQGELQIRSLSEKMAALESSSRTVDQLMVSLTSSSAEIERVVGIVKGIADQTNLLALNSAIEAARAGEYGKGFAVVSDEVRKLSEETKQSVSTIERLISSSAGYISEVNEAIKEVAGFVESGNDETEETAEMFRHIKVTLEDNQAAVKEVDAEFSSLVEVIKEIGSASDKVARSAQELNEKARDA
ncbi:globin-coupled sensor protein [Salisediminibacterium halotolerans]|uniref:Heam-based aerotactic trancducer n=1 Tax=Salisediminibacterium halotolerans TaxID=517425 RepID=A0A1H9S1W3_9BACI|nr:globin-coupled sensor protein [Salisediminibacterium haloalkalitolerans]SER79010.1 heam-based aerotactic trancducer [Salisediminibacterium haloalkalitolerans]